MKPNPDPDELLSLAEVGEIAGITRMSVHRAIRAGKLRAIWAGKTRVVMRRDMDAWIRDHKPGQRSLKKSVRKG